MCKDYIEEDRTRGISFTQDYASMPGIMSVTSGGIIHVCMAYARLSENFWR